MNAEKTYNGWTNYETWAVKLWMDNEEGSYNYWTEAAQEAWDQADYSSGSDREEDASSSLRDRLKDEMEEAAPDLGCTLWSDLLTAALSEVNWQEIAESLIGDVDKEEETPEEDEE